MNVKTKRYDKNVKMDIKTQMYGNFKACFPLVFIS